MSVVVVRRIDLTFPLNTGRCIWCCRERAERCQRRLQGCHGAHFVSSLVAGDVFLVCCHPGMRIQKTPQQVLYTKLALVLAGREVNGVLPGNEQKTCNQWSVIFSQYMSSFSPSPQHHCPPFRRMQAQNTMSKSHPSQEEMPVIPPAMPATLSRWICNCGSRRVASFTESPSPLHQNHRKFFGNLFLRGKHHRLSVAVCIR